MYFYKDRLPESQLHPMHLKIVLYFWHKTTAGLVGGMGLAIAGTLFFEDVHEPILAFLAAAGVAFIWFGWRVRIQRQFDFAMTQTAFRTYLPLCAATVVALCLGSQKIVASMMIEPPRMVFLIYLAGLIVSLAVGAQLLDYRHMAIREKISYKRRKAKRETRSNWRRTSRNRLFRI